MVETGKGRCEHGEFNLIAGCPQCVAERNARRLVKVRYLSESTGDFSPREYTYFTEDSLKVGDMVTVPVRDRLGKAQVTAVDVPESEIAAFRDKVRVIPYGSVLMPTIREAKPGDECKEIKPLPPLTSGTLKTAKEIVENMPVIDDPLISQALANLEAESGEMHADLPEPIEEPLTTAVATIQVAPEKEERLVQLKAEAVRLLDYAKARIILKEEDLGPATDDLSIIARVKKVITERRVVYLTPIRRHLDAVNAAFKDFLFPLEEADKVNREKIQAFNSAVEERRRKLAELDEKKLALAREEAALKGGEFTVDLASTPAAPPPPPRKVTTDSGSVTQVPMRTWEVVDFKALPDEYKLPDASKIGRVVRAGIPSIPGVKITEGTTLRVNARQV